MEVCLTALNWERECKSPTVPQQWTPLWLLSINAIGLLSEKALGSGGKSEDQPSIGKMPNALDVRAPGDTHYLIIKFCASVRIRVLLYKFPGGGLSWWQRLPLFRDYSLLLMLYHYDLYSYCYHRVCDCHCRCYTSHQALQSQSLIIFGLFSLFLSEKVVILQPISQLLSRKQWRNCSLLSQLFQRLFQGQWLRLIRLCR